jgi:hypothetical protein
MPRSGAVPPVVQTACQVLVALAETLGRCRSAWAVQALLEDDRGALVAHAPLVERHRLPAVDPGVERDEHDTALATPLLDRLHQPGCNTMTLIRLLNAEGADEQAERAEVSEELPRRALNWPVHSALTFPTTTPSTSATSQTLSLEAGRASSSSTHSTSPSSSGTWNRCGSCARSSGSRRASRAPGQHRHPVAPVEWSPLCGGSYRSRAWTCIRLPLGDRNGGTTTGCMHSARERRHLTCLG